MDVTKQCGQCKHWRRKGKNPIDLSAKDVGHCTLNPPQLLAIPMGVGQVDARFVYPTTPENFLACGKFEESTASFVSSLASLAEKNKSR